MRVLLDANILFSASARGSPTSVVLAAILRHGVAVITTHVCEEARRNLAAQRASYLGECARLCALMELTTAFYTGTLPSVPDEDKPVLAGAIGARCTHLWTSDRRHFGSWYGRTVHGVRMVSSVQMANELIKLGWRP